MAYAQEGKNRLKPSVRAATTVGITLSGAQVVDDVALVAGDRCLVKNQGTGSENGIYVVAVGAWTRAGDVDQSAEVRTGDLVFVREGTVGGSSLFQLETLDPITVGSTALTYGLAGGTISGSGAANQLALWSDAETLTSNSGLTYDGTTFGVKGHAAFAGSAQNKTTAAVQTTDATATTLASLTLLDNTVYWLEATIVGRDTSGTDRAFYIRSTLAYRQGAGAATLGSIQTIATDETDAAWDVTFDTSTNDVRVRVTGAAATTINWVCTLRYQGVSGAA